MVDTSVFRGIVLVMNTKTLKDVLPHEFMAGEYDDTPAYKLRDEEVVISGDDLCKRWPGPQRNVTAWWVLANGKAVGWNENPSRGWSFPVISYRA